MALTTDRNAAAELAKRIKSSRKPAESDEAGRPASDRPPGFAEALMSESPLSTEHAAHLSPADWDLIAAALENYASSSSK